MSTPTPPVRRSDQRQRSGVASTLYFAGYGAVALGGSRAGALLISPLFSANPGGDDAAHPCRGSREVTRSSWHGLRGEGVGTSTPRFTLRKSGPPALWTSWCRRYPRDVNAAEISRRGARWIEFGVSTFLGSGMILFLALVEPEPQLSPVLRVLLSLGAGALLIYGVAALRQRLVADTSGLEVRNLLSEYSLCWDEIDQFEVPAPRLSREAWGGNYGLVIVMKDGRHLHSSLWGPRAIDSPGFADGVVTYLNEMKARSTLGN